MEDYRGGKEKALGFLVGQTMAAMKAMDRPELDYFLAEFLPAFSLNLDQLE